MAVDKRTAQPGFFYRAPCDLPRRNNPAYKIVRSLNLNDSTWLHIVTTCQINSRQIPSGNLFALDDQGAKGGKGGICSKGSMVHLCDVLDPWILACSCKGPRAADAVWLGADQGTKERFDGKCASYVEAFNPPKPTVQPKKNCHGCVPLTNGRF